MTDETRYEWISDLVDGRLSGSELESAQRELAENAEAQQLYQEFISNRELLQSLPQLKLSTDFRQQVLDRIHSESGGPIAGSIVPQDETTTSSKQIIDSSSYDWRIVVGSICSVAALVLVGVFIFHEPDRSLSVADNANHQKKVQQESGEANGAATGTNEDAVKTVDQNEKYKEETLAKESVAEGSPMVRKSTENKEKGWEINTGELSRRAEPYPVAPQSALSPAQESLAVKESEAGKHQFRAKVEKSVSDNRNSFGAFGGSKNTIDQIAFVNLQKKQSVEDVERLLTHSGIAVLQDAEFEDSRADKVPSESEESKQNNAIVARSGSSENEYEVLMVEATPSSIQNLVTSFGNKSELQLALLGNNNQLMDHFYADFQQYSFSARRQVDGKRIARFHQSKDEVDNFRFNEAAGANTKHSPKPLDDPEPSVNLADANLTGQATNNGIARRLHLSQPEFEKLRSLIGAKSGLENESKKLAKKFEADDVEAVEGESNKARGRAEREKGKVAESKSESAVVQKADEKAKESHGDAAPDQASKAKATDKSADRFEEARDRVEDQKNGKSAGAKSEEETELSNQLNKPAMEQKIRLMIIFNRSQVPQATVPSADSE